MILHVIARNMQEYDRVADAVLARLNAQHEEVYGALVPVRGVADLELHHRKLTHPLHILLAPRFRDRRDWAEIEACLTAIQAKVITYESFSQGNYTEPSCQGTYVNS